MKYASTKHIGVYISIISISIFVILLIVSYDYGSIAHSYCSAPYCTIFSHIPWESYVGFGLLILSTGLGVFLAFQPHSFEKEHVISRSRLNKTIKELSKEEKKVMDEILKNDGSAFQNDLIKKTDFSKVKISRILDRLETKGLVERRRRGMANMIVLKV